jgi:predicted MFS family arabinose efflux permease
VRRIFLLYKNAYGGLSEAAWLLALIMFTNRAGSMVVPFLSIYLTTQLNLSVRQIGLVLSSFGLGSMAGSYLGGYLTDRIGHFKVQFLSLTIGGCMFIVLAYVQTYETLVVWLFFVSLVNDSLRPANASSVALYARPENVTRAFSLNRMAVNLGFSVGPAIGGMLAAISYYWLFIADGLTCIMAGIIFFIAFRKRKTYTPQKVKTDETGVKVKRKTAWNDRRYIVFAICCCMFAMMFFQLFMTLPLYYRKVYGMDEVHIGILLALNGLIVFAFEMVLVYLYGKKFKIQTFIIAGTMLTGFSFVFLNLFHGIPFLYVAMILLSFSEILAMPFMVTYTVERSSADNKGSYMGMYSLAYATAFVIAPFLGTRIIDNLGFEWLWWLTGLLAVTASGGFYFAVMYNPKDKVSAQAATSN